MDPGRLPEAGAAAAAAVIGLIAGLAPIRLLVRARPSLGPTYRALWLPALTTAAGLAVFAWSRPIGGVAAATELGGAAACLTGVAAVDLACQMIPDVLVVLLGVLALTGPLTGSWIRALLGAFVGAGLLWGVRALFRRLRRVEALGLGDVKLMAAVGALTGPIMVLWIIVAGSALGTIWGLARNRGRISGAAPLPFGALAAVPAAAALAAALLAAGP